MLSSNITLLFTDFYSKPSRFMCKAKYSKHPNQFLIYKTTTQTSCHNKIKNFKIREGPKLPTIMFSAKRT